MKISLMASPRLAIGGEPAYPQRQLDLGQHARQPRLELTLVAQTTILHLIEPPLLGWARPSTSPCAKRPIACAWTTALSCTARQNSTSSLSPDRTAGDTWAISRPVSMPASM